MTAFARRGLHGHVVDTLGRRIASGALATGEVLDLEAVEHEFRVSRTLVREALKVLMAKGMLDARPRVGTFVQAPYAWNLLDLDVMTWRASGGLDRSFIQELAEIRSIVEPGAAAMAATKRTDEHLATMREAIAGMTGGIGASMDKVAQEDVRFHRAILHAAGNSLLRAVETILQPALLARDKVALARARDTGFITLHRRVLSAIEVQEPGTAAEAMRSLLAAAADDHP